MSVSIDSSVVLIFTHKKGLVVVILVVQYSIETPLSFEEMR